jgi:hypothetical protein
MPLVVTSKIQTKNSDIVFLFVMGFSACLSQQYSNILGFQLQAGCSIHRAFANGIPASFAGGEG